MTVDILSPHHPAVSKILTPAALEFVVSLHSTFNASREKLLTQRTERQVRWDAGQRPDFLAETAPIRDGAWQVSHNPADLQDRRVEITGPVDRKMMINALNSGAKVFMADFEDSLSPTWNNVMFGQVNCMEAVRRTLEFKSPDGRDYRLNDNTAVLMVRPRGWHLHERHVLIDRQPISASLFDFGLYVFHNAHELVRRGSGPYFYLPKLESHLEARLWNDVFTFAEAAMNLPHGTIRATVLIETVLAAFEMDEILYELRDHAAGLNAGRWDYIFSLIKKFRNRPDFLLPGRAQITMTVPFMRAYTELLVSTCHKRGTHAIGGMAAFIPSRRDAEVNTRALARVREDKLRESHDGFDGTWVAHPDLVATAMTIFDAALGTGANQKQVLREEVRVTAGELTAVQLPNGVLTEDGVRTNINVSLQYLASWLAGNGAAAIDNLMEDAATAEISRAQLWQWRRHEARLDDGRTVTATLYEVIRDEELVKLNAASPGHYNQAAQLLDDLVLNETFTEFLTLPAYQFLE